MYHQLFLMTMQATGLAQILTRKIYLLCCRFSLQICSLLSGPSLVQLTGRGNSEKVFWRCILHKQSVVASAKDLASVGQEACPNINALFEDMSEVAAKGQIM